ncbi:acylneuraminate cytidylyltransferase family protein [Zoogloea sp.]|uniref:acylneuraminate cytidylyltransferase family protein n=1 Tax=Zoogloea sp. TaxID=49181 RepID=UPI001AC96D87|nr:acylneuraminate cytidylyltransferase family protein [Zoogloea sp.]MBN8282124.1 acylneuraminate cytidylyltransferase family protein [Zoogloea sp.]
MKNLVVIPARGGSKGIPRKNVKDIGGKPLIAWSIEHAISAKCVDRVVVSTDCPEIAEIAKAYGAEVPFMRPADLANDRAPTEPSLIHALDFLREKDRYHPDNVVLLQATSPVRACDAIDNAFQEFSNRNADSLVSVCEMWNFLWKDLDSPKALYDFQNRPRRQDIEKKDVKFKENGSIYISKSNGLVREKNRLFGKVAMYVMSEEESFEIDTELDWVIVETILKSFSSGV